jgi:CRP/FNR family transcriptional regulator, anaerobic regulatory protein
MPMTVSDAESEIGDGTPLNGDRVGGDRIGASDPSCEALAEQFMTYGASLLVGDRKLLDLSQPEGVRFYLVQSGLLLVTIDLLDGRRQVLCLYGPGDVIFCGGILGGRSTRFRAVGDVLVQVLSAEAVRAPIAAESATTTDLLLAEATRQIDTVLLHNAAIGRLRSDERLATFFLEMALRLGQPVLKGGDAMSFSLGMRRDDIADYLGLNPDTLSRGISRLRQQGVVVFVQGGKVIVRREALCERTPLALLLLARFDTSRL